MSKLSHSDEATMNAIDAKRMAENGDGPICVLVGGRVRLFCPACTTIHEATVDGSRGWTWDGNFEAPTISPSLLVTSNPPKGQRVCHSFVREGKFIFLDDCTHTMAGQTIPCAPLPEWAIR